MNDDTPTNPEAALDPFGPGGTEPAPPMTFGDHREQRYSAKAVIPEDGFSSEAGEILNLVHGGIGGSVSVLWCRAGSFRASHWHRRDSHRLHVLEGEVRYYERSVGSGGRSDFPGYEFGETFVSGDTFDTPPNREHLLVFDAPTILISMSSRSRTHEEHEADVVRVPRESWNV